MNTNRTWIRTVSGGKLHFVDPVPSEMFIDEVAHALSCVNRFTGHASRPYSVLEHSMGVYDLTRAHGPQLAMDGLMHDMSEYALNDVSSPLKTRLPNYKDIETRFMEVGAIRFGFEFPLDPRVKDADLIMIIVETRDLMGVKTHEEMNDFLGMEPENLRVQWLDMVTHMSIPKHEPHREHLKSHFIETYYRLHKLIRHP
jgi:hypothetical protein